MIPNLPPAEATTPSAAAARARLRAFAWDYLLIFGYLLLLLAGGLFLTLGPARASWITLMSNPFRADLVAFLLTVLPVTLYFSFFESSRARASWGKRRAGLVVVAAGALSGLGIGRALLRNGLKFLPWQIAHSAMFHIPGFPMETEAIPVSSVAALWLTWLLVGLHLLGLTRLAGGRPLYDRLAGTVVLPRDVASAREIDGHASA